MTSLSKDFGNKDVEKIEEFENLKDYGNLDELEHFRFSNGSAFPESYKDFVRNYGYGVTLGEFLIYIPMGNKCDSIFTQTVAIKQSYIEDVCNADIWFDMEPDGSIELIKRLYPFASSENGMYLFWDIHHNKSEYDIYMTDFRGNGIRKVGNHLYELFNNLTNSDTYKKFDLFAIEPYPTTFKPMKYHE